VQELRIAIGPWDPISLVAISSADDMSWMLKTAESELGEGNAATRFHQNA
jgi:hypothetical protein